MQPIPSFTGVISDGKLDIDNVERMQSHIKSLSRDEPRKVVITIKPYRKSRSNNQNKYYWGVVIAILSDEIGYSTEEMHEALKYKFLLVDNYKEIPTVRSTSDLSTIEFEEYMTNVRQWASADLQIYIPLPNETDYDYDIQNLK